MLTQVQNIKAVLLSLSAKISLFNVHIILWRIDTRTLKFMIFEFKIFKMVRLLSTTATEYPFLIYSQRSCWRIYSKIFYQYDEYWLEGKQGFALFTFFHVFFDKTGLIIICSVSFHFLEKIRLNINVIEYRQGQRV